MSDLLNGKQLAEALGIKHSAFHVWKKAGKLRQFEVTRPLGQRRYSAALVADYKAGRSMTQFRRSA
jgi:predicted site-specific integrase-resolvase